jgi:hypothetical protein
MRQPEFLCLVVVGALSVACGGDEGGSGGGGGSKKLDACAIVTQSDATALFGQPAEKGASGSPAIDPAMLGECLWEWQNAVADSHLLQFRVWEGAGYYNPDTKAVPFAIGDEGAVHSDPSWGVDVQWKQGDRIGDLSYFTVGAVPKAMTKVEDVKALALSAAAKLK